MIFTSSCCDNLSIDEIIERAEKGDCGDAANLLI